MVLISTSTKSLESSFVTSTTLCAMTSRRANKEGFPASPLNDTMPILLSLSVCLSLAIIFFYCIALCCQNINQTGHSPLGRTQPGQRSQRILPQQILHLRRVRISAFDMPSTKTRGQSVSRMTKPQVAFVAAMDSTTTSHYKSTRHTVAQVQDKRAASDAALLGSFNRHFGTDLSGVEFLDKLMAAVEDDTRRWGTPCADRDPRRKKPEVGKIFATVRALQESTGPPRQRTLRRVKGRIPEIRGQFSM